MLRWFRRYKASKGAWLFWYGVNQAAIVFLLLFGVLNFAGDNSKSITDADVYFGPMAVVVVLVTHFARDRDRNPIQDSAFFLSTAFCAAIWGAIRLCKGFSPLSAALYNFGPAFIISIGFVLLPGLKYWRKNPGKGAPITDQTVATT